MRPFPQTLRPWQAGLLAAAVLGPLVLTAWAAERRPPSSRATTPRPAGPEGVGRVVRSEAEWRKLLTPEQYRVLRKEGTERAFTGAYWNHHAAGTYLCAGCGLELFSSRAKFDSGTGWPSYTQPVAGAHVRTHEDRSLGMVRVEVECARCGGHLGHLFDDGPPPAGLRYCINSASLRFAGAR